MSYRAHPSSSHRSSRCHQLRLNSPSVTVSSPASSWRAGAQACKAARAPGTFPRGCLLELPAAGSGGGHGGGSAEPSPRYVGGAHAVWPAGPCPGCAALQRPPFCRPRLRPCGRRWGPVSPSVSQSRLSRTYTGSAAVTPKRRFTSVPELQVRALCTVVQCPCADVFMPSRRAIGNAGRRTA